MYRVEATKLVKVTITYYGKGGIGSTRVTEPRNLEWFYLDDTPGSRRAHAVIYGMDGNVISTLCGLPLRKLMPWPNTQYMLLESHVLTYPESYKDKFSPLRCETCQKAHKELPVAPEQPIRLSIRNYVQSDPI